MVLINPRFLRRKPTIASLIVLILTSLALYFVFLPRGLVRETQWPAQSGSVGPLLFTPDGKTLISGGSETIRFWDPANGRPKSAPPCSASPIALSSQGRFLACPR